MIYLLIDRLTMFVLGDFNEDLAQLIVLALASVYLASLAETSNPQSVAIVRLEIRVECS